MFGSLAEAANSRSYDFISIQVKHRDTEGEQSTLREGARASLGAGPHTFDVMAVLRGPRDEKVHRERRGQAKAFGSEVFPAPLSFSAVFSLRWVSWFVAVHNRPP